MENNNNNDDEKKDKTQLLEEDNGSLNNNIAEKKKSCELNPELTEMKRDKHHFIKTDSHSYIFLLVCIVGVSLGILLEIINAANRTQRFSKDNCVERPKYWVFPEDLSNAPKEKSSLKHVHLVLERAGYEKSTNKTPWDLLWTHTYPFSKLHACISNLQPHQRMNHIPGAGFITNKVSLATSNAKYVPKAFRLPNDKDAFLKYAAENKNSLFLKKHNQHRGVSLKNVSEIDVTDKASFVQEYVQNPFLVDGHKFDIGVYVVITSVIPLRAYWYKGDVLLRYCPAKYHPFNPKNLDQYVIRDDYLPTWEVPSLAQHYTALGYGMKDAFDIYVRSKGKDPVPMWEEVQAAIVDVLLLNEERLVAAIKRYRSQDNFFEMMRFDLILDENLKVHLLEANMSPNLSSGHFSGNALLYEQVLYNLFSLTGISRKPHLGNGDLSNKAAAESMVSSQKNIAVFGDQCRTACNDDCSAAELCKLCKPCRDRHLKNTLLKAHNEFIHRGDFRRLVPPPMMPMKDTEDLAATVPKTLSDISRLQRMWYQGKCNQDITWCT